jgi:hypothetical protein
MQKKCTKCKTIKKITDYSRDVRSSDGRVARCKKCFAEYIRNKRNEKEEIIAFDYYE